ncbi:MAG TPA: RelA/SpoT family protein [Ktedonobacteraceae bacterium]|nr:RelA/SpoT family protein [Ktedonobacteraceae bacterium]
MPVDEQITIHDNAQKAARRLLQIIRHYMTEAEVEQVARAIQLAQETSAAAREHSQATLQCLRQLPPLQHALAVATILAETRIDAVGVAAGVVFEAVDAELLPLERVENELGTVVSRIVESMLKLNILERKKQAGMQLRASGDADGTRDQKKRRVREALQRQQAETVRKMFIGMAEDPRVVLLKLAYRLHAMRLVVEHRRRADPDPADQQEMLAMAQETREIYAPLAGRLGMSRVESELEDLAFEVLEPDRCAWMRSQVEMESKQWGSYVSRVCDILRREMMSIGLKAEVSGRVKHLYSFYKKLQRSAQEINGDDGSLESLQSALAMSQVHDLVAFRILVDTTQDCYVALGHVHSLWKPKEGRIKDFIANPKPNGYQALHTTIFCLDDQLVEIQIRTFAMHEMAEFGVAMHWHYKDVGDRASASAKELLTWLRQLAEWQRELRASSASDAEFVEAVKGDMFEEQIFIFTPKGEVKDLPVGSTPLDFAYRIHTKLGDKCAGARIISEGGSGASGRLITRMVPLDYELKSGEIVEIVTNRTAHPTRDWLNFAHTAAARSKIRRYLKAHERDINIQIGRERLDRELKALGVVRGVEALSEDMQRWLEEEYADNGRDKSGRYEDVLAAIGCDDIRQHGVAVKLVERWPQLREGRETKAEDAPQPLATPKQDAPAHLQVAGESGLLTRLANCCCPLPGDEIVGFISRGKGAIVHRADCRNIERYRQRERERLVSVSWVSMGQQRYLAPVIMTARDRPGLIHDIAAVVSELGVNMTSVSTNVSSSRQLATISVMLEIESLEQLQRLIVRLERVKDVHHAERDMGNKRK